MVCARAQPQLLSSGTLPMRCGECFEDGDRVEDLSGCDPLMRAPMKARLALEDRALDDGKTGIGLALAGECSHATGLELEDLGSARADQIGDHDKTGDVENIQEPSEFGGRADRIGPAVR